jgi:transcriptional regulator with XRE-family HTH domain
MLDMEQNQIDQSRRLQQLIKALNMNQSKFAKQLGVTQPNISRMVTGESRISTEILNRIILAHKNVNLHWLLTGDGEMFMESTQEKSSPMNTPSKNNIITGKGRLEELEERMGRLEAAMKRLMGDDI